MNKFLTSEEIIRRQELAAMIAEQRAQVAMAEHAMSNTWTWRALVTTDPELAAELRAQREDFVYACITGTIEDVEIQGQGTVRGFQAAVDALERAGTKPDAVPPDLQGMIEAHGSWDKVTNEAWAKYGEVMAKWQAAMRYGELRMPPPLGPKVEGRED